MKCLICDTVDVSEWTDFMYYDLCQYFDKKSLEEHPKLGRWKGLLHILGSALLYWILAAKGTVIARTKVQHGTRDEVSTDDCQSRITQFHEK